jgi:CheY-like chemotaxis protein
MQNLHVDEPHVATPSIANSITLAPGDLPAFSVPASAAYPNRPPAAVGADSDAALPPILIADDDADDRFFIKRLIAKTGVPNPVLAFDDGSEVVNHLGAIAAAGPVVRRRAPRLLFLDLKMTGLGGFGFLEWARQQKTTLPMTIVVLSNSAEPADVAKALSLGAHRYLVKYPSVQTFSTIIRSVYPVAMAGAPGGR